MSSHENFSSQLSAMGIPDNQIYLIQNHLVQAKSEIVSPDPGLPAAFEWLENQVKHVFPSSQCNKVMAVVHRNAPAYVSPSSESGFDSCQSRRALAKIVGEAIAVGGFTREYELMGLPLNSHRVREYTGSQLNLDADDIRIFKNFTESGAADQDFLFPGVTPTDSSCDLEQAVLDTLSGTPPVGVRSIIGLGGLRADREESSVNDMPSYFRHKLTSDHRFYPGMAVLDALNRFSPNQIPTFNRLEPLHPEVYRRLIGFKSHLNSIPVVHIPDVSTLCCSAIPTWNHTKNALSSAVDARLELSPAFHSPSYDISFLEELLSDLHYGRPITPETVIWGITLLENQLHRLFSFNNPLHLPFTQDRSEKANGIMGVITNKAGDSCTRFGIGHSGRSLEIVEYSFGSSRSFSETSGNFAYQVKYYPQSHLFLGPSASSFITPESPFWHTVEKEGFIKASLRELTTL
jgi:hypothetical protein